MCVSTGSFWDVVESALCVGVRRRRRIERPAMLEPTEPTESSTTLVVELVDMRQAALDYGERALRVFPLFEVDDGVCVCREGAACTAPGKHPRIKEWQALATDHAPTIAKWWGRWPNAGIGLVTGAANRFVVADFDGEQGVESLAQLEVEHGPTPVTPIAITGRGLHVLFRVDEDSTLRNAIGLLPGVDRRANGGYIVAPPTLHVSGRRYAWHSGLGPEMADVPHWLSERHLAALPASATSLPATSPANGNSDSHQPYVRAALEREVREVVSAKEGTRNARLNVAAFNLAQLVAGQELDEQMVRTELLRAALACGLGQRESIATIASGFTAGAKHPRAVPERVVTSPPTESTALNESSDAAQALPSSLTIAAILDRWRKDGPLRRVPTGIAALDAMCRGGLPLPWRVQVVGAPSAGKTAFTIVIANHFARVAEEAGACVGILAVDEDPDDVTIRLAQLAGFTVAEAEARAHSTLDAMEVALKSLRIRMYDASQSIESASTDLAQWALSENRSAVLVIDSLQTVMPDAEGARATAREHVEANVRAMRRASDELRMLVISTSEANRAAYRDLSNPQNDIAAGAESRAIEFSAQTQLVLRTPPGHPDVIHVKVSKNRRATRGEFWLRLDRETHALTKCEDPCPKADDEAATKRAEAKAARTKAEFERETRQLMSLIAKRPGMNSRELREYTAEHLGWGHVKCDRARTRLESGFDGWRLVNAGTKAVQKLQLEFVSSEEPS